jgi:phosphatidylglycerol:prolipoprotein diacylglycerol transferase
MFYYNLNPILLKIGFLEIRYYGLMYVASFIIIYFLLRYLIKIREIELKKDDILNLMFYLLIGVLIGARVFVVLIYDPSFYFSNPAEIIKIWHGGLSFHGGLIGALVVGLIYSKKKKIKFYKIADLFVIPLGIGLMLGRIGNFINGELYGRITNLPWAFKFKGVEGFRHPSQLYEALKNFVIFLIMWNLKDKKLKDGFLFWLFIALYGIFRFLIEFFREPDPQIGLIYGLSLGQIFCLAMFIIGSIILSYKYIKD